MHGKAHPLIPLTACELLLIGQLIGTPAFSAALALLVVSRRTRTQPSGLQKQKLIYRGRVYWRGQQSSSTVDFVYYTYRTLLGAALANLTCTIHTTDAKSVATATSLEWSKRELQIAHLYSYSSTISANSVKIGSLDVEIIDINH